MKNLIWSGPWLLSFTFLDLSVSLTSWPSCGFIFQLDDYLSNIVQSYGDKLLLQESDKRPRTSRQREKKRLNSHVKHTEKLISDEDWQGPPPWDISFSGDENPKFLCDVMV